jgi:hypothetical protein
LLRIGGPSARRGIPPGFLGLSLEYWAVPDYAGPNPRRVNPVCLRLIRNLTGGSAQVLRIGGVTSDNTWWPTKGVPKPAGVVFGLTRRWIRTIGAVAARLDARLILGINFEADSRRVAATEARALVAGVGRGRVQALACRRRARLLRPRHVRLGCPGGIAAAEGLADRQAGLNV